MITAAVFSLLVLIVVYVYLAAPGNVTADMRSKLCGHNYAHRGLHTPDKVVPENSLAAIKAAADAGYGIEFDVHITKDDKLVVFHDNKLGRVCGQEGIVEEMTCEQLMQVHLHGTDETIPTFDQVLDSVDGRVPLIIELKAGKTGKDMLLCSLVAERLSKYYGPFCIESFDPRIVAWFKRNRPDIIRGQLLMQRDSYENLGKVMPFMLSNGLTNVATRPHFIAHKKGEKSLSVRFCQILGAMKVVWTVHPEDDPHKIEAENDAVIFEYYHPGTMFGVKK